MMMMTGASRPSWMGGCGVCWNFVLIHLGGNPAP